MQATKLDAISEILNGFTEEMKNHKREAFSFKWMARQIAKRQVHGKDCIIIITGDRRTGKSTWGLKLIRRYIKARRKQDPGFKWGWKKNFPISRREAQEMAVTLEKKSFTQFDEGGDQFYRQETNKRAQRELIKFLNKSGSMKHLTIVIWPDVFTLDPKLLNMAQLLVVIPYRTMNEEVGWKGCAWGFLFGRSNNPFNYDKFGIEKLKKKMASPTKGSGKVSIPMLDGRMTVQHKGKPLEIRYPKTLFRFLRSQPNFMMSHRFGPLPKDYEDRYIKSVKERQLMAHAEDDFVSVAEFERLKQQYQVLLYNLYMKDDKSYAQLERLHISPIDGIHLKRTPAIKSMIESIKARL